MKFTVAERVWLELNYIFYAVVGFVVIPFYFLLAAIDVFASWLAGDVDEE